MIYRYVCGFAFTPSLRSLLLVRKTRPDWQAGLLNGVGGKIDEGESNIDAMWREWCEETGLPNPHWERLCNLDHCGNHIGFYWGVSKFIVDHPRTNDVGESLLLVDPRNIPRSSIPGLHWLIPLALDTETCKPVHVRNTTPVGESATKGAG